MAGPYHGKTGRVSHGGTVASSLTSWDFTTSIDVADTTPMGATNDWETQATGLSDFSGTAEGIASSALSTVALLANDASAIFIFSNGDSGDDNQFEGNAIITSLTETVNTDDVGKLTYAFEGNDAAGLTFSTSGTSAAAVIAGAFHGKKAGVSWGGQAMFRPKEWSCTMTASTADSTAMAASNNSRTRLVGFKAATATWTVQMSNEGFSDGNASTIALGDEGTLKLNRSSGSDATGGYTGTATITGMDTTNPVQGITEATYSAKFNGAVTFVS